MKNFLQQSIIHAIWICILLISVNANAQNGYCNTTGGNQASVVTIASEELMVMPATLRGEGNSLFDLSTLANSLGATILFTYQSGLQHWGLPESITIGGTTLDTEWDFVNYLNSDPTVEFAEPNYIIALSSNDPLLTNQWSLNGNFSSSIDAIECWDLNTGRADRTIGLIDSGVDWGHEDLTANIWQNRKSSASSQSNSGNINYVLNGTNTIQQIDSYTNPISTTPIGGNGGSLTIVNNGEDIDGDGQLLVWNGHQWEFDPDDINGIDDDGNGYIDDFIGWDFVNDDNDPRPDQADSHGTHVAGIIAAQGNNRTGITGVHWNAKLMVLKCFDGLGQGSISNIIKALEYSLDKEVKITNNSYGGPTCASSLYEAIGAANRQGQLFVTAAGNNASDNDDEDYFPANYDHPNIVAVMSVNSSENVSVNSNYGFLNVDIAAPGEMIYSTLPNNSYGYKTGTSMATPHVTGALALLWDKDLNLTHLEVKEYILCNSEFLPDLEYKCLSEGYLNLGNINGYDINATVELSNHCSGGGACLSIDPVLPNASYVWNFSSGVSELGSNPEYHSYYGNIACVDVTTDCGDNYQTCFNLTADKTNIELLASDLQINSIYPNPVEQFVNINCSTNKGDLLSINLYNSSGQLIKTLLEDELLETRSVSRRFDLGNLKSGIYLMEVSSNNDVKFEKILKK